MQGRINPFSLRLRGKRACGNRSDRRGANLANHTAERWTDERMRCAASGLHDGPGDIGPTRPDIEMQSVPRYQSLKSILRFGEVHIAWLGRTPCERPLPLTECGRIHMDA